MDEAIRVFFRELSQSHFSAVLKHSAAKLTAFIEIWENCGRRVENMKFRRTVIRMHAASYGR